MVDIITMLKIILYILLNVNKKILKCVFSKLLRNQYNVSTGIGIYGIILTKVRKKLLSFAASGTDLKQ